MTTTIYNVAMFLVDLLTLRSISRSTSQQAFRTLRMSLYQVGLVGSLLAFFLAGTFGRLRLLSYGIFAHGTLILLAAGWLLWKSQRRLSIASLLAAASLMGIAVDAFLIEPHWLETTHIQLTSPKLTQPLKIALLADFQTDEIGPYEYRVLRETMQEQPDLILLAGDYIQEPDPNRYAELRQQFRSALEKEKFSAPLGIFAVRGNVDPGHWQSLFQGLPVAASATTQTSELQGIQITALSVVDSFRPSLRVAATASFHIVLGHAPDFALGEIDADLLVAGHIHGGQVRLPWFGPLITFSQVPRSWSSGLTRLEDGGVLVVSRGIGMERGKAPRLRFLCRPQLVFIEISPAS